MERKTGIGIGDKKGKGIREKSRKWNWREGKERDLERRTGKRIVEKEGNRDWSKGQECGLERRKRKREEKRTGKRIGEKKEKGMGEKDRKRN